MREAYLLKEPAFHQAVGGRERKDLRYANKGVAPLIRYLIIIYRMTNPGTSNKKIAEMINTSSTTLSLAAGGRAGKRIGPDGKTTMDRIVSDLVKLNLGNGKITNNRGGNDHV